MPYSRHWFLIGYKVGQIKKTIINGKMEYLTICM